MDIRRNFFTQRVVKHWNESEEMVELPSLELFKLDAALGAMV